MLVVPSSCAHRNMRRPRRRLVYTTGLRDPGIPSLVPPDSFLKCEDEDSPTGAADEPSNSLPEDANPRSDLSRETRALRQIRWEVQQLELEANYSRILQDLSTSRIVLEEVVDDVVATCEEAKSHDDGDVAGRWRPAPGECSQASGYSIKEITSERRFATSFHTKERSPCVKEERLPRASNEARARESMLSALERVKKIRDTLAGPPVPASQSAAVASGAESTAECDIIPREKVGQSSEERMALETTKVWPVSENLAFEPLGALRPGVRFSSRDGLHSPCLPWDGKYPRAGLDLCDLEQSLWGTLPFDLVERILARLPLPCLLSCRAVCRKWNRTLLDDRGFLAVYSGIPPQKPWLFTWDSWIEDDSHAYNPKLDKWYKIPLRFIPHEHVKRPLHIVGAVGGLLVFEYFARLYMALCVCNPVTKAWRKLPPLFEKRVQPVVAVFEDRERRGEFTVVVAGGLSKPSVMHKVYSTEIFESRTSSWRKTCDKITEDGGHIRWGPYVRTAFCNGNLYYMLWRFKLLAYNLRSGTWSHVPAPSPPALDPESGISPFLVESRGRLLMIGFHDNESHIPQDGLVIWQLNAAATVWVEIARMPDKFFATMPLRKIQGVGCADLIYIFENFSAPVVICDISKHTPEWRQIDSGCIRGNSRVIYGCTTDLRLDALLA